MNRERVLFLAVFVAAIALLGILFGSSRMLAQVYPKGRGTAPNSLQVVTDTTIANFNLGALYHTELESIDDGSISLQAIGLAGGWQDASTTNLPPRYFHSSALVGNHIYVFGGSNGNASAPLSDCWYTTIQADHTLSAWQATSALPLALDDTAAVAVNNTVYVLGGFDGTFARGRVYRANVNANGSLSAWVQDAITLPESVDHSGATAVNGFIYLIGGERNAPPPSQHAWYTRPNADGSLGTWVATTDLPPPDYDTGVSGHIVTSYTDGRVTKVFVATGFRSDGATVPDVYSATADPSTGALGAWTQNTSYTQNLVYSAGVSYGTPQCGGNLYFSGGLENQNRTATANVATSVLLPAPSYLATGWYDTPNLGIARYGHTMIASTDGWLYVIDGSDSNGNPVNSIRFGETACAAAGGSTRAPDGYFISRALDTGASSVFYNLDFNTSVATGQPITMTFSYRFGDNPNFPGQSFSTPVVVAPGISQTTVLTLTGIQARYLQYQVTMARDNSALTQTPYLNWVTLSFTTPPTPTPGPGTFTPTPSIPPGANLQAQAIEMLPFGSHRPNLQGQVMFNVTVVNTGTTAIPAGSRLEADVFTHLSAPPTDTDPSDTFAATNLAQPLEPGQQIILVTNPISLTTAGPFTLYGWVNRYGYIAETNYDDNIVGPLNTCAYAADGQSFTDVPAGPPAPYFYTPVEFLYCRGVVSGYSDGTFRPYNNTTRSQFAKMDSLAVGWTIVTPAGGAFTFADVPPTFPFFPFVETAASHGVISGYACGGATEPCDSQNRPYYRPYANITRGQLAKIIALSKQWELLTPATPTFSDVPATSPFYAFVETVYYKGVVSGYNCGATCLEYRPGNNGTRGQLSKMLYLAVIQQ